MGKKKRKEKKEEEEGEGCRGGRKKEMEGRKEGRRRQNKTILEFAECFKNSSISNYLKINIRKTNN